MCLPAFLIADFAGFAIIRQSSKPAVANTMIHTLF